MKREIEKDFEIWRNSPYRKPLIVRGARQVGKTYSIKKFASEKFENTVVLDFEKNPDFKRVFSSELSPDKLIPTIEIIANSRIIPQKTLLFFDEIQACPRAISALRYFYEELPGLHVISAGSLLEMALGDISFPVGRVEFLWMRPMSFSEYLTATGFDILAENYPLYEHDYTLSEIAHRQYIEQLKKYFFIGGMPEAVLRFVQSNSFQEVKKVHQNLMDTFWQSFHHYSEKVDRESLTTILRQIPQNIGNQIKYTRLDPNNRIEKTKATLGILEKSLLIQIIRSCSANQLPLGATASDKVFKLLFLDIGLMQYISGVDPLYLTENAELMTLYQGALAEQFVGQELLAANHGSEQGKLYYWARAEKSSHAEIDYLISRNSQIIPIEVKSASAGRLRSLNLFLQEHPHCLYGIVLSTANYQNKILDKLHFHPLYIRL